MKIFYTMQLKTDQDDHFNYSDFNCAFIDMWVILKITQNYSI